MKQITITDHENILSKMLVKAKDSFVEFTNTESELLMGVYPDIAKNGDIEPNTRSYIKSKPLCKEYFNLRIIHPDQFIKIVKLMNTPSLELFVNEKGVVVDFKIRDERLEQQFRCLIPTGNPLNDSYKKAKLLQTNGGFSLSKKDFQEIKTIITTNENAGHADDLLTFTIKEDTGDVYISSKSFKIKHKDIYHSKSDTGNILDGNFYWKFSEFKQFPIVSEIINVEVARHPIQNVLIFTFDQQKKDEIEMFSFVMSCAKY